VAQQGLAEQNAAVPADFVAAHRSILADTSVQHSLSATPPIKPPELPEWLKWLGEIAKLLDAFGPIAKIIFWLFLAFIVLSILFFIVRELGYTEWPWRKRAVAEEGEKWAPDEAPARALLAEADALAAAGHYAAAAHLLLLRSVEDIDRARPGILKPSSTAREISRSDRLPERARTTFGLIARHVEASLFGGRTLSADIWQQCRESYRSFALGSDPA
jgi:hypothetical protein